MEYYKTKVENVRKAYRKRIEEKKAHNEQVKENAALSGRIHSKEKLEDYEMEKKHLEILKYVEDGSEMKVPKWIESKTKKINE